jgi:GGDEF domain-containing protein
MPTYLDENGKIIRPSKKPKAPDPVYLDDNGEPVELPAETAGSAPAPPATRSRGGISPGVEKFVTSQTLPPAPSPAIIPTPVAKPEELYEPGKPEPRFREPIRQQRQSVRDAMTGAAEAVKTSTIPSFIAGASNQRIPQVSEADRLEFIREARALPEDERARRGITAQDLIDPRPEMLWAWKENSTPREESNRISREFREGTATLRETARETALAENPGYDPESKAALAGSFVGTLADPVFLLQPEYGVPRAVVSRIGRAAWGQAAKRITAYAAKQGVNIPMDVAVGALATGLKGGEITPETIATDAAAAFVFRNAFSAIGALGRAAKGEAILRPLRVVSDETDVPLAEMFQRMQRGDDTVSFGETRIPKDVDPVGRNRLIQETWDLLKTEPDSDIVPDDVRIAVEEGLIQNKADLADYMNGGRSSRATSPPDARAGADVQPTTERRATAGSQREYVASRLAQRQRELATENNLPEDHPLVAKAARADIDIKTGIRNANAFAEAKGSEVASTAVDFAFLGKLNDFAGREYGDAFGDEMLATMARVLDEATGNAGRAYRRGGDEFVILWDDPVEAERIWPTITGKLDEAIVVFERDGQPEIEFQGLPHYIAHEDTADAASAAVNRLKPSKDDVGTRARLFEPIRNRIEAGRIQRENPAAGRSGLRGSEGADRQPLEDVASPVDEIDSPAATPTLGAERTFSAAALRETFNLTAEEATAAEAIADAMGLDKSRIAVVRGGLRADGSLAQAAPRRSNWYVDNIESALQSWQAKGTPDQLVAHLKKTKGATEEAEAIRLAEWLADKKSVTRDEVLAFLDENRIEVVDALKVGKETKFHEWKTITVPGEKDYRELLLVWRRPDATPPKQFTSTHFPERDILAHVRLSTLERSNGERILLVHEIQSDLHQAGRREGYGTLPEGDTYIPDAPFKGEGWKRLAVKRLLAVAADEGYTGVGIVTGDAAAKAMQVSIEAWGVSWRRAPNNGRILTLRIPGDSKTLRVDRDGIVTRVAPETAQNEALFLKKRIEDVVPDDLAQQIRSSDRGAYEPGKLFTVGGRGMRGFYDREIVNIINDVGKKLGIRVDGQKSITDARVEVYDVRTGNTIGYAASDEAAERYIAKHTERELAYVPSSSPRVHYLPISAEARRAIGEQGLPLFQGDRGAVEFTTAGKAVVRALTSPDVSTAVHEIAHVARRFLLDRSIPPEQRLGISDEHIQIAEEWSGAVDGEWTRAAEEKFARGFERYLRDGQAPSEGLRQVFASFATWLRSIYERIIGSGLDVEISDEMRGVYDALVTRRERLAEGTPRSQENKLIAVQYAMQNIARREAARTAGEPTMKQAAADLLRDIKANVVDGLSPIEDLIHAATGPNIAPSQDVTNQFDRVIMSEHIAGHFAKELTDIIRDVPEVDIFGEYLVAKHALAGGAETGRDATADAQLVAAWDDIFEPWAERVRKYVDDLNKVALDAGIISQDSIDYWREVYPDYVPLNRIFNATEDVSQSAGTSALASLGQQTVYRKRVGSTREIENPLNSLLTRTRQVFRQSEQNKAARMLVEQGRVLAENPLGLEPVRLAENVTRRKEVLTELSAVSKERRKLWRERSARRREARGADTKINAAIRKIDGDMAAAMEESQAIFDALRVHAADIGADQRIDDLLERSLADDRKIASLQDQLWSLYDELDTLQNDTDALYERAKVAAADGRDDARRAALNAGLRTTRKIHAKEGRANEISADYDRETADAFDRAEDEIRLQDLRERDRLENRGLNVDRRIHEIEGRREFVETRGNLARKRNELRELAGVLQAAIDERTARMKILRQDLFDRRDRTLSPADGTISFLVDGVRETWRIDPYYANVAKGLNVQQMDALARILAVPARVLKIGATGLNVAFLAKNPVRDLPTAIINSETGFGVAREMGRAVFESVNHGALYDEIASQGGMFTSFDQFRSAPRETLESVRSQRTASGRAKYLVTHPSELLRAAEDIVGRAEQATRMAVYAAEKRRALAAGMTEAEARIAAKRASLWTTGSFHRQGAWGRVLKASAPYLNASIQGSRVTVAAMKNRPVQTAAKIAAYPVFLVGLVTVWNLSDPQRKKAYDQIMDFEKENSIVILPPNPKKTSDGMWNAIKIPLPQGVAKWATLLRRPMEAWYGLDRVKFMEVAQALLGTVSPVSTPAEVGANVVPQAARPALETLVNRNFFTRRDIVPRQLEGKPPEKQVGRKTSGVARLIGKATGAAPLQVDHLIRGYTAGVGQQAVNGIDRLLAAAGIIKEEQIGGEGPIDMTKRGFYGAYAERKRKKN